MRCNSQVDTTTHLVIYLADTLSGYLGFYGNSSHWEEAWYVFANYGTENLKKIGEEQDGTKDSGTLFLQGGSFFIFELGF